MGSRADRVGEPRDDGERCRDIRGIAEGVVRHACVERPRGIEFRRLERQRLEETQCLPQPRVDRRRLVVVEDCIDELLVA